MIILGIEEINELQKGIPRSEIEISPTDQCKALVTDYRKNPSINKRCPLCNLQLLTRARDNSGWDYLHIPVGKGKEASINEPIKIDCDHWIPVRYVYLFLCQKKKITKAKLRELDNKLNPIPIKSDKKMCQN